VACFFPLPAFAVRGSGKLKVGFNRGGSGDKLELPCGRCIGCRLDRRRAWSLRNMHEAQMWDSNLFVTLDYSPEKLSSWSLQYRDFQLFMKRLRKAVKGVSKAPSGKRPLRFFVSGEYGSRFRRPHFHALLYNTDFADKVRFVNGTFRSSLAEELWGNGQVVIGEVTARSAAYCAGYTLDKVYGSAGADHYEDLVDPNTGEVTSRRPEFCAMSRRPGIGAWWYERNRSDLFVSGSSSHDFAVMDGQRYRVPRYYYERLKCDAPTVAEEIAYARFLRAQAVDDAENSEERREVRAQVARARLDSSRGERSVSL